MMTTSYPHNGGMPPQGMQHAHPGMSGPGPNLGQHGMPPGMQHVSGPNGPVSQAGLMMGMQPGMSTNAHALSHLQPQPHMFQQQQQHQMMSPTMMQQQRTAQQAFMHRQQQQAILAHQQGGMGMGFQNPMNLNQAQAQQLQMMRTGQMGGPMGQNPQQRQQMPPPPAPTNEQPRPEPSPSVSNQAPPTPNQGKKANPKKKLTKDNKPANRKGGNAGAMKRRVEPTISKDNSNKDNKQLRSRFMALQKRHGF